MMAAARCPLPNRPVPASHTDVPGRAVVLRALQAICARSAFFCPSGRPDSVPAESVSPLGSGAGGVATVRHVLASTSMIH